jgi:hypothetical protein
MPEKPLSNTPPVGSSVMDAPGNRLIDHAEALRRAREYFVSKGSLFTSVVRVEEIAELIQQAVRDTAEECAAIARRGETTGEQLTGYGIEKDIRTAFSVPRSVTPARQTVREAKTVSLPVSAHRFKHVGVNRLCGKCGGGHLHPIHTEYPDA